MTAADAFSVERSCRSKNRYRTHDAARAIHAQMVLRGGLRNQGLHVYACPHCGGYHIGHKTASVQARLQRAADDARRTP